MSEKTQAQSLAEIREQLLLAQVRIAELEDVREALTQRVAEERSCTEAAQRLADELLGRLASPTSTPRPQGTPSDDPLARIHALVAQFDETKAALAKAEARLAELDGERRRMKTSRSWRWTAPIRSIERWFARRREG